MAGTVTERRDLGQQDTLGQRIGHVRYLVGRLAGGRQPSQGEFGRLIGEKMNREPFSATAVGQWELGRQMPDLLTLAVMAIVGQVDPGWLTFGGLSQAPAPRTWEALGPFDPPSPSQFRFEGEKPDAGLVSDIEAGERAEAAGKGRQPKRRGA
jgi:hypothetical protein